MSPGAAGEACHPPGLGKFCPVAGIGHRLVAREHVGKGPHVAGALDVVLPPQGVDAAALHAEVSEQHLQVGDSLHVVLAAGVLRDAQGVAEHHGLDRGDSAGEVPDHLGADAADGGGALGRICANVRLQLVEIDGAGLHEFAVVQVFRDQYVHQRIEKGDVRPHADGHMQRRQVHQCVPAGVHHDELCALHHRVFYKGGCHGVGFHHVGADDHEHLGAREFAERVGHGTRTESSRQTGDRRGVSGTRAVIDVVGADRRAKQLLHLVGVFVDAAGAADPGNGVRPVLVFNRR